MKIYTETEMHRFDAWGGAVDTMKVISQADKFAELEELAEECFGDGAVSATTINDWLWFDAENIFDALGIECEEN